MGDVVSIARPAARVVVGPAAPAQLALVNEIVRAAVMAWPLAERVKRLALGSLQYDELDALELDMGLAERLGRPVGLVAWDGATPLVGGHQRGALLHGLYVRPEAQRQGVGIALQQWAAESAASLGFDGLLVKAERLAVPYFEGLAYQRLGSPNPFGIDYPYLFWRSLR